MEIDRGQPGVSEVTDPTMDIARSRGVWPRYRDHSTARLTPGRKLSIFISGIPPSVSGNCGNDYGITVHEAPPT